MREFPTVAQSMSEQEDLHSLCADRPLATSEIFSPNAYYGMDRILKTYADVPRDRALKFVIPHGIEYSEDYVWSAEIKAPLPVRVYFPPRFGRAYRERAGQVVLRTASPFLYLEDLVDQDSLPEPRGTLFFPSHSTHWVSAVSEFDTLADRLESLPARFHPISVCVYWRDFLLGHHDAFARRGFRIVSAGHMYDSSFLFRLFYLCRLHRYAASNELGSHLVYAVKAGCSYFHLASETRYVYEGARGEDISVIPSETRANFESLFSQPKDELSSKQIGLIDEYAGADYKMSPATMREFFRFCETLDCIGTAVWDRRRHWLFPRVVKRGLWHKPKAAAASALRFASRALSHAALEK